MTDINGRLYAAPCDADRGVETGMGSGRGACDTRRKLFHEYEHDWETLASAYRAVGTMYHFRAESRLPAICLR